MRSCEFSASGSPALEIGVSLSGQLAPTIKPSPRREFPKHTIACATGTVPTFAVIQHRGDFGGNHGMRGPQLRVQYDVRRLWCCPQCGYERHAPATEVAVRCHCTRDEPLMKLVEGQRPVRPAGKPIDPYVDAQELIDGEKSDLSVEADASAAVSPPQEADARAESTENAPVAESSRSAEASSDRPSNDTSREDT